jgi:hypothetical protein
VFVLPVLTPRISVLNGLAKAFADAAIVRDVVAPVGCVRANSAAKEADCGADNCELKYVPLFGLTVSVYPQPPIETDAALNVSPYDTGHGRRADASASKSRFMARGSS